MAIINKKKAFAFSFVALFLSFLIFAFGSLYLFQGEFTKDYTFKEARILNLNNEIKYFKEVYFKNSLGFSLYNVLDSLINYTSITPEDDLERNYTKLNALIFEGLLNESFKSVPQTSLENKGIEYFVEMFQQSFEENQKGNFGFDILRINVYEEAPYYVSIQLLVSFNITTFDNVSSWNSVESMRLSVPIIDLDDPEFLIYGGFNYSIRPIEFYKPTLNWSFEIFNESINEVYSSVYLESSHRYTLGSSFLKRLFNISESSYKNVIGFWSFDYDEDEEGIWDSSLRNQDGRFYGSSKLLLNFNNEIPKDITAYNNVVVEYGDVNCSKRGVRGFGCGFDSSGDFLEVVSKPQIPDRNENYTVSVWVNVDDFSVDYGSGWNGFIFSRGSEAVRQGHHVALKTDGSLYVTHYAEDHDTGVDLVTGRWYNIVDVYNGTHDIVYINGVLNTTIKLGGTLDITNTNIKIGRHANVDSFYFDGRIDEVAVYSQVLSDSEISRIYKEKKALMVDYVESYNGLGIRFDGVNSSVGVEQDVFDVLNDELTIEVWIKPNYVTQKQILFSILLDTLQDYIEISIDNMEEINFVSNHQAGEDLLSVQSVIEEGKNHYLVFVFNETEKQIYHNGKKIGESFGLDELLMSSQNITFGAGGFGTADFFNGIIDEVKIYNRTLSENEINLNYYNYKSISKGCCNYVTLVSPNKMGYNTLAYSDKVSYSSKAFYDYYNRGKKYNLTLYEITNITSSQIDEEYYNFRFDLCMMGAFQVFNFDTNPKIIPGDSYSAFCSELVSRGIY